MSDSERLLVLLRHGQSEWNLKNLFTGWRDVDLSPLGFEEAKEAGRRMNGMAQGGLPVDVAETIAWYANPASSGVNGNIVGVNPMLGPLQNNGGPTQTIAPLAGSPAIDAGSNADAPGPTDQRGTGFPRIVHNRIDIGAYESQSTTGPTGSGPGSSRPPGS